MIRLILFDIDGTLLWPGPTPKVCLGQAMQAVFGTKGDIDGYSFGGKTDPQIVADLMRGAGVPESVVRDNLPMVFEEYLELLQKNLHAQDMELYPGTQPLLNALSLRADVMMGLVTGNLEAGARIKLSRFGLADFFVVGAYGSDSANRDDLPRLARQRAADLCGEPIAPDRVVVVGDSPLDVRCARACGAKAVAVATGRTPLARLASENPDALMENMNDTALVLRTLMEV